MNEHVTNLNYSPRMLEIIGNAFLMYVYTIYDEENKNLSIGLGKALIAQLNPSSGSHPENELYAHLASIKKSYEAFITRELKKNNVPVKLENISIKTGNSLLLPEKSSNISCFREYLASADEVRLKSIRKCIDEKLIALENRPGIISLLKIINSFLRKSGFYLRENEEIFNINEILKRLEEIDFVLKTYHELIEEKQELLKALEIKLCENRPEHIVKKIKAIFEVLYIGPYIKKEQIEDCVRFFNEAQANEKIYNTFYNLIEYLQGWYEVNINFIEKKFDSEYAKIRLTQMRDLKILLTNDVPDPPLTRNDLINAYEQTNEACVMIEYKCQEIFLIRNTLNAALASLGNDFDEKITTRLEYLMHEVVTHEDRSEKMLEDVEKLINYYHNISRPSENFPPPSDLVISNTKLLITALYNFEINFSALYVKEKKELIDNVEFLGIKITHDDDNNSDHDSDHDSNLSKIYFNLIKHVKTSTNIDKIKIALESLNKLEILYNNLAKEIDAINAELDAINQSKMDYLVFIYQNMPHHKMYIEFCDMLVEIIQSNQKDIASKLEKNARYITSIKDLIATCKWQIQKEAEKSPKKRARPDTAPIPKAKRTKHTDADADATTAPPIRSLA